MVSGIPSPVNKSICLGTISFTTARHKLYPGIKYHQNHQVGNASRSDEKPNHMLIPYSNMSIGKPAPLNKVNEDKNKVKIKSGNMENPIITVIQTSWSSHWLRHAYRMHY